MNQQDRFKEIEQKALTNKYLVLRNHPVMEIELVNVECQTIICLTKENDYVHIEYDDITDEDLFLDGDRTYTIKIPEIHYVEIEVVAVSEEEAKDIAEQMYNDSELEHESIYDSTFSKDKWILSY